MRIAASYSLGTMFSLTYYKQQREDGGVRTGIDANGDTILHRFEDGNAEEKSPALDWYVDVRCSIEAEEVGDARIWFHQHHKLIDRALRMAADKLLAGVDFGGEPWLGAEDREAGIRVAISCSAQRRVDALEMQRHIEEVRVGLLNDIDRLTPLAEPVS